MAAFGKVIEARRMRDVNDLHSHTLPQVTKSDGLRVHGEWPNQVQITQGWAKAIARPWNDDFEAVALRLERGSSRFLRLCAGFVSDFASPVLSPALLPARARVWKEAGFEFSDQLALLEHNLRHVPRAPELPNSDLPESELPNSELPVNGTRVLAGPLQPTEELYEIDQAAFPIRWRMGRQGLIESVDATHRSAVHRIASGASGSTSVTGFAVTGISLGQGYLQRLAVHPRAQGKGLGSALVRASLLWARGHGARAALVNTQSENEPALRLYQRAGFENVPGGLVVMSAK